MFVAVLKETCPGELRVSLVPNELARLTKRKLEVGVERGAGIAAGYPDAQYEAKGAKLGSRAELLQKADIVLFVRGMGSNPLKGAEDLAGMNNKQTIIGLLDPLLNAKAASQLATAGVNAFSLELLPRITRAQSMDVLSSMANIAGYKSVLLAATMLPKLFPMLITAAGTISPAKILVLGVGVAGLQAIATARRLGGVVEAYDVRPEVKEQVVSVGGKFVELDLPKAEAGDKSGYAKAQSEEFIKRQQDALATYVRAADVIITTAAVPGRRAPILITADMLKGSKPGAVLIDLAAETGGNCALTQAGETIHVDGVAIVGPVNLAGSVPFHASQLYARNIATFLEHITDAEGQIKVDLADEITKETLVAQGGKVVHPRVVKALEAPAA